MRKSVYLSYTERCNGTIAPSGIRVEGASANPVTGRGKIMDIHDLIGELESRSNESITRP